MKIKLGSVISEYSVRNKADEDIPVYSVTNDKGFCTGYFSKEVASKDKTTYKIVPRGYFAYNPSRINVGSVDWQHCEDRVIVSPLYVVFSVSQELDQRYLLHYLKSDVIQAYIKTYATGSVRDNLKYSILEEFPINLPALEEQRQIADILDGISNVIDMRKQEVAELEELVKSRFSELFGADIKESSLKISDIAEDTTVGIANSATHAYSDSGVVMLRNQNIRINRLDDSDLIYIKPEFAANYQNKALQENDILVTRTGANVGMACVVPAKYAGCQTFTTLILRLRKDIDISPIFVCHYINSPIGKDFIDENKMGGAQPNFGARQLATMPIAIPSKAKQDKFDVLVKQADKSKLAIQKSIVELEELKKSLMQKYFG
jgi:type I restriction enzyme S subunit